MALISGVAAATIMGAACGDTGDSDRADEPGSPSTSEAAGASDDTTFVAVDIDWEDPPTSLPAGATSVVLRNEGDAEHSLVFEDTDLRLVAAAGEEKSGEVELEAGELYFFCDVPGHEDAGMNGTIAVG